VKARNTQPSRWLNIDALVPAELVTRTAAVNRDLDELIPSLVEIICRAARVIQDATIVGNKLRAELLHSVDLTHELEGIPINDIGVCAYDALTNWAHTTAEMATGTFDVHRKLDMTRDMVERAANVQTQLPRRERPLRRALMREAQRPDPHDRRSSLSIGPRQQSNSDST
jgi:hypothetical protein